LLGKRPRRIELSAAAARTLEEFETLREIQARNGERASHRYILSMTSGAANIWDVVLLGWQAGLVKSHGGALQSTFDAIPLFETVDDLEAGPDILAQLLKDRHYRRLLRSRGNFQEVMLGYSDSVKDGGYFAANWALFRAQKRLWEVAEKHKIRLGLFHGKGGTIGRGGGQSHRSVQAQPYAAPGGRMRITEQGEVISLKYANLEIAERNMEQLVTSVLDTHMMAPKHPPPESQSASWEEHAQEIASASREFYRNLVYETPGFIEFFRQATPIDLIENLRLGSRPSRRSNTRDINQLRAIPWVFAWTQSRHFIPAWYGLGYGLEKFLGGHLPGGFDVLRQMYRHWPFFAVIIDNAEASLAKTDLYIARRYDALCRPASLRQQISSRIEEEYQRTVRYVLEISESKHLLERQPVLQESIRLRNPYVDPLNFLQIRFLEKWRRELQPSPELVRLLQITVGGIAFGMKSTG
jgi:phosphoenolpyruvate carboxylase